MGLLLLVRHGQASFGADDYDVLSGDGWEQGRLLGTWLRDRGEAPDAWVRGALRRHRETLEATALAPDAGAVEVRVDPAWDELDHLSVVGALPEVRSGELDLADRRSFQAAYERATERWQAGDHDDEYAESWPAFVERVRGALDAAAAEAGSGRTVGVVSSGGPIGLVAALLADPDAEPPAVARTWARLNAVTVNTAVTRVLVGGRGARLLTFNEHSHLDRRTTTYR